MLPLQIIVPVIHMHPSVDWNVSSIQCVPSNDMDSLRSSMASAKCMYIDIAGSLPHIDRVVHAPAWALLILIENCA